MSDVELIARLRELASFERGVGVMQDFYCGDEMVAAADRIEALTAKLAKAVEAVDKTAALIEDRHVVHMTAKGRNPKDYISDWSLIAKEVRATLAEIKRESHD